MECIDIDTKYDLTGTLYKEFKSLINDQIEGLGKKFVVQKTPSGGYHFLYRCVEVPVSGNEKLANRPTTQEEVLKTIANAALKGKTPEEANKFGSQDKVRVLIETRGEGGYFGCFPSAGYEVVYGSLENIQTITAHEREVIFACARTFNEVYEEAKVERKQETVYSQHKSPFEDYNENSDIRELLESHGWTLARTNGRKYYYLRPGGEQMWSSEYDDGKRLLFVWTTSSSFEGNKAYNAAQILTILQFGGDYSAAAKWLITQGYGDAPERHGEVPLRQQKAPAAPASKIEVEGDDYSFLATQEEADDYIVRKRNGTFVMGAKTGFAILDKYYRFKEKQLDMIIGHDNMGKSIVSWYFSVLDCLLNDQYYIIFAGENTVGGVKCKLMEYYLCKSIEKMNDLEYRKAKEWVEKRYKLIKNDEAWSYLDMINMGWKLLKIFPATKFIIEPWNVLEKNTTNDHQYEYDAMRNLRLFIKKSGIGILLNIHASTEALRKTYPKEHDYYGYVIPPNKADAEGGGKFPNKADNFISVHRMADHPTEWVWTEIHIQKIKEYETGGQRTFKNEPVKLRLSMGGCGFEDQDGYNPIIEWHNTNSKDIQMELRPNNEFLNASPLVEKDPVVHTGNRSFYENDMEEDAPF